MQFMSKELQEAFDIAKPVLEKIAETKDQISNEIKYIENSLKEFSINDNFEYIIQSPYHTTSFTDSNIGEYSLAGSAKTNEALIIWDKDKKRLMYQLSQYNASVDFDSNTPVLLDEESQIQLLLKPLIETTFDVRKYIYEENHLSKFLIELSSKYQLKIKEKAIDSSDIPF